MIRDKFIRLIIAFSIIFLLTHCSNEPSYNVDFYRRAEEFKQKNPNVIVSSDGKRIFQAKGESGVLNPAVAKAKPKIENQPIADNIPIKGEVLQLNAMPDSIGNVYFLGYCKNIGNRSIHYGKVTVRLFDKNKKELANSFGFCIDKQLAVNQTTPVKILVQKAPKYESFTAELSSQNLSSSDTEKPILEISESKLIKGSNQIVGKLKNTGSKEVSFPTVTAVTFNKGKKMIGIDTGYLQEKKLKPTESSEFNVNVYISNGDIPKTFELSSDGIIKN